ncbi:hypothetical protein GCM10025858_23170 [Alicyclobacillus sacchari]|nr:hypothetical protein GCM10025858_23170 [Alicyclobacillus sacchari]
MMKNANKYTRQYSMPPESSWNWVKKEYVDKAPIWCSVDLRDGNQALVVPMNLEEKLEYFQLLVDIGFKEIEVGFPAASDTEFVFLRTLIERDLIPDDVTIQVLTQSRDHIIRRTFESLMGAKRAIVHLYNSTSIAQREQVFRKPKSEIVEIAVSGAQLCKQLALETPGNFMFQYSPESFTARRSILRSKSVMQSSMFGSRPPSARLSSIYHRPFSSRCRMSTQVRSNI